jgi:hypothetical protein
MRGKGRPARCNANDTKPNYLDQGNLILETSTRSLRRLSRTLVGFPLGRLVPSLGQVMKRMLSTDPGKDEDP